MATGIAELVSQVMALEGMDIQEARSRNALFAINGLFVASRKDLAEFQKPFAQDRAPVSTFVDAAKALRPTGILGVSAVPKLFTREVIEAMAEINERPIIFPYSIPTSRSECSAEEAYRWSAGRAVFASGSPFPLVEIAARKFVPGQGNNVYIFPAVGMAVYATEATRVIGFRLGRGIFIEGVLARMMYHSLRMIHERALNGTPMLYSVSSHAHYRAAPAPQ
jgi:malate dehydrogenase (oxaloacetate-decarboxylating)(NADP+)